MTPRDAVDRAAVRELFDEWVEADPDNGNTVVGYSDRGRFHRLLDALPAAPAVPPAPHNPAHDAYFTGDDMYPHDEHGRCVCAECRPPAPIHEAEAAAEQRQEAAMCLHPRPVWVSNSTIGDESDWKFCPDCGKVMR